MSPLAPNNLRPCRTWTTAFARLARRILPLLWGCALGGCHSVPLGEMLSPEFESGEAGVVRASFGQPAVEILPEGPPAREEPLADVQLIDLPTALRRAGAANPMIALAEEAVRVRLAEQTQARALLFPTLDAGANLRVHRGNLLTGRGVITDVKLQSLYWGFGADAKGGGTVAVPGIRLVSHLADAVYAPRAAQHKVVQSRGDASATNSYVLLEVGIRYLVLVEAQARRGAFEESLREFEEIERLTAKFAKAGQGRDSDAQRAKTETLLLRAAAERSQEDINVAAAELARLLDLAPVASLRGADAVPPLLEMIDRGLTLEVLLERAIASHPEIVARSAEVAFQEVRVRQERVRPWLPLVAVGFSAGEFGGSGESTTSRLGNFIPRTDLDVALVWSLPNAGVGARAVQHVTDAELRAAQFALTRAIDRVRREVVEAHSVSDARRQDLALARERLKTSRSAYDQELARAKNLQGRPLEVLVSANQLASARQDAVLAMATYSQAQLQLHVALGSAP
ncbi:MAG: TolC family protein [Gemmataceae bacterium]|nr:TolC family protein [Gemmataceae bacterium]